MKQFHGRGSIIIPLSLDMLPNASLQAGMIGAGSSECPGLLLLEDMIQCSWILMCGVFDNNDGISVINTREPSGNLLSTTYPRCLLTESGHYLLKADRYQVNDKSVTQNNNAYDAPSMTTSIRLRRLTLNWMRGGEH